MPSIQAKMISGFFKLIGVNKMLDKQGADLNYIRHDNIDIPLPGKLVLQSPVLATGDDAYLLSPLLYDLSGFPEIDVFYGTREVMIAYLKDFQKTCRRYGVKLNTHIGKDMMHCWGAMELAVGL